jgi:hypothetical protein
LAVQLGGNDFFGVPFPLVLADRFFHIYSHNEKFAIDIFRWDIETKSAVYEVKSSKPLTKNIETNPTGIVTFSEEGGGFLFKFRPKPGVSQIFGYVPVQDEIAVHIDDRSVRVTRGATTVATLQRNQFSGIPIGIEIAADGSMGIGVFRLPEGMNLTRAA